MVNISRKFMQQLYNDQRNYLVRVVINLADTNQTVLTLTNENIWDFSPTIDDAVSSDEDLQVGTAIINKFSFTINNIYETYSQYDFKDAKVFLTVGLDIGDDTVERIKKGTFYVDTADYNDTFITLECLDGMHKFEKPFKANTITFPATAGYIVNSICTTCGVILDTTSFPNKDYIITSAPDKDTCTYREVLAWIAQICGCFARFNSNGNLELKWYDRASLETVIDGLDGGVFDVTTLSSYQTGDTANGGSFNPWNTGDVYDSGDFTDMIKNVHFINTAYSHTMSVDDVVITGVRILVKTKDVVDSETGAVTNTDVISTHFQGTEGYIIEISENPFITEDNVNVIISYLGTQLIGLRFRKANLSVPSDPSIEAGDVAIYWDRKGIYHPILVSRTTFITGDAQTIVSSAQTPARNSAERYSAETKNYVAVRKQIREEKNARQLMFDDFQEQMEHASGMYCTEVEDEETHAVTTYYHNKQLLEESDIQIVISDVGISVTNTGTAETPTWYGLKVDGDFIAHILTAEGINADWINAGTVDGQYINAKNLSVSDNNGIRTFYIDDDGNVEIRPTTFTLAGKTVQELIELNTKKSSGNLLRDPVGLSASYYEISGTVTRGEADPDGGTNAVSLTATSSNSYIRANKTTNNPLRQAGKRYKFSVWLKSSSNASSATGKGIKLMLNNKASSEIFPTTDWKLYSFDVQVDTVASSFVASIGGDGSFTTTDGYTLYIYEPKVEYMYSKEEIINMLSNNDEVNGIWMDDNGDLYINLSVLHGGTAKFGGSGNGNGVIDVYSSSNSLHARIDNGGFKFTQTGDFATDLTIFEYGGFSKIKRNAAGTATVYNGSFKVEPISAGSAFHRCAIHYHQNFTVFSGEGSSTPKLVVNDTSTKAYGDLLYTGQCRSDSDRRLKENIEPAEFNIIDELKPVSFDWKKSGKHVTAGFIAQDVQEILPELVGESDGMLTLDYIGIIPHLVHKVQQQQKQINDLEARIERLEALMKEGETKR